jgi:hypothetical protein
VEWREEVRFRDGREGRGDVSVRARERERERGGRGDGGEMERGGRGDVCICERERARGMWREVGREGERERENCTGKR